MSQLTARDVLSLRPDRHPERGAFLLGKPRVGAPLAASTAHHFLINLSSSKCCHGVDTWPPFLDHHGPPGPPARARVPPAPPLSSAPKAKLHPEAGCGARGQHHKMSPSAFLSPREAACLRAQGTPLLANLDCSGNTSGGNPPSRTNICTTSNSVLPRVVKATVL